MNFLRKIALLSILLVWGGSAAFAQEFQYDPSAPLPVDSAVKVGKLKNGFTYYIRQNKLPENKVELRLAVNAGSVLENDDQQGLAHFVEHMAFNGSKDYPGNSVVKEIESMGIRFGNDLNAYTSFDETVYMLPIPSDKFEEGMRIMENWAFHLAFEDQEIDDERGVILEEWRLGKGAMDRMREKFFPVLLYGSKYPDRLPIGKEEILKTFPYQTIRDFYHAWYRPDNMALIVVGDIDPAVVEKSIQEHFGKAKNPKKAPIRQEIQIPHHADSKAVVVTDKEMSSTQVQVMFKIPSRIDETQGDYVASVMKTLYGLMLSQRLTEISQKPGAPFMYAGAGYSSLLRPTDAFMAVAMCAPGGSMEAFKALLTETERAQRYGFTEGELERAKAMLLASYEQSYANRDKTLSENRVDEYIRAFLEHEPIPGIAFEYNLIKAALPTVTLEQVNALSKSLITDDNRVVIVLGPEGQPYPTAEELVGVFDAVEKDQTIQPYEDGLTATQLMEQAPQAGRVVSEKSYAEVGVTEWTLSNGAKVVLKPTTFKDDEILFSATSRGGRSLYTAEDDINISNATAVLDGVNGIRDTDLQKLLAGKNVSVMPYIAAYFEGMSGRFVQKDMKEAFELIYLDFTAPNFTDEYFQVYKKNMKDRVANAMDDPDSYFQYKKKELLGNGNPRSLPAFYLPEQYDRMDLSRIEQIYRERFAGADDFTFFFVGSFTLDQIKPFVETYLASLPAKGIKEQYKDMNLDYPKGPVSATFNKGVDEKAQVDIYWKKDVEYDSQAAFDLQVFGRILMMRLISALREEMGGTYSPGAIGQATYTPRGEAVFRIVFASNLEMYEALRQRALSELDKLLTEGPTEKEVADQKAQNLVQWAESIEKNNFWLSALDQQYELGKPVDKILDQKKWIDELSAQKIRDTARKYIDRENSVTIFCLPEEK